MTQSPSPNDKTTKQPPMTTKAAILLLTTLLDTTWRAFVPTIGGTLLGVTLDNTFHQAPLFTTVLIVVGFVVSGLLIALQIRSVRKNR